ncbi:anti-sigma factor RsiW [Prosthecobacter fusiformis]|uniref:Anti-sigma factor RsiW n=1 Tax=Prosthecobacter fusiformis TaxID=48464 RepID=A0A4R7SQB4_9BACT|nr:YfbK domain-containing protein [Prosthecobacter fusiformis]TDU81154.1 anti-sigma factor RsiW [Prosthecobacter fusiformis]
MKSSPHENPDLTAYALGELHARQATEIHALLAACPVATHELEQVEAVTDALRQGAPIPQDRLLPEQRHAVLYPTNLPRRMGPLMPRPIPRKPSIFRPIINGVIKAAAIVVLTGAAYIIGRHTGLGTAPEEIIVETAAPAPVIVPQETPVVAKEPEAMVALAPEADAPVIEEVEAILTPAPVSEKAEIAAISSPAPVPMVVAAPSAKPDAVLTKPMAAPVASISSRPLPLTTPGRHVAFLSASRHPVDQFDLTPAQIRPRPAKVNKNSLLAAPAPIRQAPESKDNGKPRTPDLYIHSWKADVASCPWNEDHRLLRVTIQLPADQPAAMTKASYPLRVTFDPNNVREYRQLCERHQPAAELRKAGTHVVWYEFLPNGSGDGVKTVATVTLDKGHFTTQTVGPFDSTKLSIQDAGGAWTQAREDFVFDSAVVGFGLLMRGVPSTPQLDHGLVLRLAEQSKGADVTGERGRFIKLVREAAGAAGL